MIWPNDVFLLIGSFARGRTLVCNLLALNSPASCCGAKHRLWKQKDAKSQRIRGREKCSKKPGGSRQASRFGLSKETTGESKTFLNTANQTKLPEIPHGIYLTNFFPPLQFSVWDELSSGSFKRLAQLQLQFAGAESKHEPELYQFCSFCKHICCGCQMLSKSTLNPASRRETLPSDKRNVFCHPLVASHLLLRASG